MANRKGNVVVVFLVIFAVLTVILGVTTIIFYQQWTKMKTEMDRAKDEAKKAIDARTLSQQQVTTLKTRIGFQPDVDYGKDDEAPGGTTVMSIITGDLQKYADQSNFTYRHALNKLSTELDDKNKALQQLTDDKLALEKRFGTERTVQTVEVNEHNKARVDRVEELNKLQAETGQKITAMEQEKQVFETLANDLAQKEQQARNTHDAYVKKSTIEHDKLVQKNEKFEAERDRALAVGKPVGSVVTVDLAMHQVYVNLGEADRLPRRTTFSIWTPDKHATPHWEKKGEKLKEVAEKVFDKSDQKVVLAPHEEGGPKAYIEIVQILGPHQSVGRLTMDKPLDPVVPGDLLFSPIWSRGEKKHYALVGRFDLTGKGTNNRALLIEMIKRQGGVIDAEVDDKGTIDGDVEVETDYLIEGSIPEAADPSDLQASSGDAIRAARTELRAKAKRLGVEIIDQHKLYDFMGYQPGSAKYEAGEYTGGPEPLKRFENPSSSTRPTGVPPAFEKPGVSTRPTGLPGKSNYGK